MADDRDIEIALCVFREANDALVVFDPAAGRVVDVNPTTLRLTGLPRKAALASTLSDLISSPDPADYRRLVASGRSTGFSRSREGFLLACRDGPPIPVEVGVSRIHTRPEPLGLAIIRDVSARMKAQAELTEARDRLEARVLERTAELEGAVLAMRRAIEEAEAAGRVKDRFLAVVSHELRTPLTPVLAVASALLDGPGVEPALRPTLEMVRRNVALEARLIDDLLDAMRAGRGELRLDPEPVDALELIDRAAEICRPEADDAGVALVVEPGAASHRVMADPTRFQQVAWNLLRNAVASTEPGGTIVVRTADPGGGRLAVSVSDPGRGIAPELLTKIFEPFERGERPPGGRQGGLGLGLAICRSIVEGHGGRLDAASEGVGRGATFTFDVPLAPGPVEAGGEAEPTGAPEAGPAALDILLVEDNKTVLRYLKLVLEMKGHRVVAAADLAGARQALAGPFDLLISDIELPDGSGLDLMREVRGRAPGIAISGFGAADDLRMSRDAGFALHLTKPIESRRLDEAIARVMRSRPSP